MVVKVVKVVVARGHEAQPSRAAKGAKARRLHMFRQHTEGFTLRRHQVIGDTDIERP